jgi:hypothetical protein
MVPAMRVLGVELLPSAPPPPPPPSMPGTISEGKPGACKPWRGAAWVEAPRARRSATEVTGAGAAAMGERHDVDEDP